LWHRRLSKLRNLNPRCAGANGNKSPAARLLGLWRNALRYRLSKIGIADKGEKET
jgi:DNA-binding NtrC family response regulator